jgi:hypothetical protein
LLGCFLICMGPSVSNEVVVLVVDAVLKKKELNSVDASFAIKELKEFLKRDPKALRYLKKGLGKGGVNSRSSEFKRVVSSVRKNLRRYHGLFSEGDRDYDKMVSELSSAKSFASLKKKALEVLSMHTSSKERASDYGFVWKQIWGLCYLSDLKKVRFLDLGCGFNPFSLIGLDKKQLGKIEFNSYDINVSEQDVLNKFYTGLSKTVDGFAGESGLLDLLDVSLVSSLPESDVCLMFKVTDHLDKGKGHKNTENVVVAVSAQFVVLSFPTVTRTGLPMKYPQRRWVEIMSERLGYVWEKFETKNEMFYVIDKRQADHH